MHTGFFNDFYETLSSIPEQRIFLFMTGKRMGKAHPPKVKTLDEKDDMTPLVELFKEQNLGDLDIKQINSDKKEFLFTLQNSAFETDLHKPSCTVASGLLAGYIESIYNTYSGAKETKCISQGDSHCEFEVKVLGDKKLNK